jgi:hypothetical protein
MVGIIGVITTVGQETIGDTTIIGVGIMAGMEITGDTTIITTQVGDWDGILGMDLAGMVIMVEVIMADIIATTTITGVGTVVI